MNQALPQRIQGRLMNTFESGLLWPLILQVWLTVIIGLLTLKARVKAAKQGEVSLSYFKHNRGQAPESMLRWGDNLQNQFELPILFYVIVIVLSITQQVDIFYIIGAWVFVISRYVHSYVHISKNHIGQRLTSFLVGFFTLILMWLYFSLQQLTISF